MEDDLSRTVDALPGLVWTSYMGSAESGDRREAPRRRLRFQGDASATPADRLRHLTLLWSAGGAALALATWACFELGVREGPVACIFEVVLVVLALTGSFLTSAFFSFLAVGCLDFFFSPPLFSFTVTSQNDVTKLFVFLLTSLAITALVRHGRRLAEGQREQARLLDLTHDGVVVRDMTNAITYWNQGANELFGWSKKEAIGQIAWRLLQTRFPIPLEEITEQLLLTGRWEGELVRTTRNGTQVVVASRWSLQRDASGRPFATLETNNDITARKHAEEALRQSQAAYLAEAQQLSLTGSFGWNTLSGEIFWSEQSFRIFEYDPSITPTVELVLERVHPDDVELVQRVIDRAVRTGQDFDFEHRLLMPGGTIKHLHVVAHAASEEQDKGQFIGAIMDVTAARQAEERLHEARAELAHVSRLTTLGELSASIVHEVNQPLGAIVTCGENCLRWMRYVPPQLDEVRACVERIIADGWRASETVRRIRMLTKGAALQKAPLDLNDVINDVVLLVHREVSSHRVSLRLELAPGLPPPLGDRVQLQQVMINLVMNGIQAMEGIDDRPRELLIESRQDGDGNVIVAVQDSGTGVDPQRADRLFEAFFTTKPDGMGMGLAICRSVIEAHSGRIGAFNNVGHGATFQCTLPAAGERTSYQELADCPLSATDPPLAPAGNREGHHNY